MQYTGFFDLFDCFSPGLALVGVWTYMTSKNWPDTSKFRGCTYEYVQIFLSRVSVRRKIMSWRIDARPAWVNDHWPLSMTDRLAVYSRRTGVKSVMCIILYSSQRLINNHACLGPYSVIICVYFIQLVICARPAYPKKFVRRTDYVQI